MKMIKKIKKISVKVKNILRSSWYIHYYYHAELDEKLILLDSKNGKDLGGNILRLAQELSENLEYKSYKLCFSSNNNSKEQLKKLLNTYNIHYSRIVKEAGFRHYKVLASAKYLITDTSFPLEFIKKDGQTIINTWHGTPLKKMGKDIDNQAYSMGNVQKSLLAADYLLYPSDYMKNIMVQAYCLENIYEGKILCSGYPRNSVFFKSEQGEELRRKLFSEKKKVYAYMPTWRGIVGTVQIDGQIAELDSYFQQLDKALAEDEILLVRLHPFVAKAMDYSKYLHITSFPEGYEPYDILNTVDCLVTDYSSVFFDFANSGKKIVLFLYDKERYLDERGIYVQLDSFPFPQVDSVTELIKELRTPKDYNDTEFKEKYCQYDGLNVAAEVCRHIIKNKKVFQEETVEKNGNENILICCGVLARNGLTTAFLNLLEHVDRQKRNYFVTFVKSGLKRDPLRVKQLPSWVGIVPISGFFGRTPLEVIATVLYFRKNKKNHWITKYVDRYYSREYYKHYGKCDYKYVIHYSGYGEKMLTLFQNANTKNIVFVHNNMVKELEGKSNQHALTVKRAYASYYKVVPVTSDIYEPTFELGGNEKNIQIVNNCHDNKGVLNKSHKKVIFDEKTVCSLSEEELCEILHNSENKFITIGRFSHEKGHRMLIDAFNRYYKREKEGYLIIIGGYGPLYEETLQYVQTLEIKNRVIIIHYMSNPMPVLKQCDLFILSSIYEGLGLVILEADTLGIPVISTDIPGPRGFMKEHGGYLVAPNADGIYEGMIAFGRGEVHAMNVDYEEYNRMAVDQFEQLFN
ncbi:glycosyltransferase [Blautia marasmi]|uniref:glycosyltransferase n=1 Tax=Blautia marasmi TaxID=1917868 RepID=UPI0025931659|nr:glycosyltransferase [uncultured Blautia sp.]